MWSGAVRREDREEYADYMRATGIPGYRNARGNHRVFMLRRDVDEVSEFVMLSLWASMESVRGFAGRTPERAVFYPEDDRYLVRRDLVVRHYEVVANVGDAGAVGAENREGMIGRIWHGWTTPENADVYQRLLEHEVLPGIESRASGYDGVHVLRRADGDRVEFVTLTLWESFDAIRSLVGDDLEAAYVPSEAREVLADFDQRSVHYEIVLQAPRAVCKGPARYRGDP